MDSGQDAEQDYAHTADLELALRMADLADSITARRFRAADLRVSTKPDRTPVTDADTAVEDLLRSTLAANRPRDAVVGEERGGSASAHRAWILDPIDGTKNFSRGMPVWATLIALTVAGRAVVGVVSAPALARRWWAAAGGGAWTGELAGHLTSNLAGNPASGGSGVGPGHPARAIAVSGVAELTDAYVSTTEIGMFLADRTADRYLELVERSWISRAFGDFWQHVLVAEGVLDVAVDPEGSPWDLAAVQVIVEEAGGRFTDLGGSPRYDGGSAVSSNGLLHEVTLSVLRP